MLRECFLTLVLFGAQTRTGAEETGIERLSLFEDFSQGWRERWREQRLFTRPTRYEVVNDEGQPVLHATSNAANAGLIRETMRARPTQAQLRWRWKVRAVLPGNTRERERAGDDYAARVFVVFETSLNPLRTRAINYVWAATEKSGTMFASPYTKNVAVIVLRSGDSDAGEWRTEVRDVLADYRMFFGEGPKRISAVAVSVDTDNTKSEAEAWFADLVLESNQAAAKGRAP